MICLALNYYLVKSKFIHHIILLNLCIFYIFIFSSLCKGNWYSLKMAIPWSPLNVGLQCILWIIVLLGGWAHLIMVSYDRYTEYWINREQFCYFHVFVIWYTNVLHAITCTSTSCSNVTKINKTLKNHYFKFKNLLYIIYK